ncbi:energy transducer TonB [Enterovibrio calviensis]|uniref:energy transducer TonB n=1 Tax=Enterovibrio calviensis TaxID=91359 RepID=UPI000488BE56|nr:energy transducer TonB [Enterovibrio calviensis]
MLRWVVALGFSIICVIGLFGLMAKMVTPSETAAKQVGDALAFDIVMVESESDLARRTRALPPEPPTPPAAPQVPTSNPQTLSTPNLFDASLDQVLPDVSMDLSVAGIQTSMPAVTQQLDVSSQLPSMETGSAQMATPIVRVNATYPPKALKRGIEGYVVISFTIDRNGRPSDLKVIEAKPKRMFEREAMRALKKWKYTPKSVNGEAIEQQGQTVKLEFMLAK